MIRVTGGGCVELNEAGTVCRLGKFCQCVNEPLPLGGTPINPSHYKQGTVECYDAIASMLSQEELRGYLRGNMMKYTWRYRHKGGVTDLDKADWYFNKLKEMERGK